MPGLFLLVILAALALAFPLPSPCHLSGQEMIQVNQKLFFLRQPNLAWRRRQKKVAGESSSVLRVLELIGEGESVSRQKGKHLKNVEGNGLEAQYLASGSLFHPPLTLLATV